MLLRARPWLQPSLHTTGALFLHTETSFCFTRASYVKRNNSFHFNSWNELPQPRAARSDGRPGPFIPPHSLAMAIERSISHFTACYTFFCHSQLPLHSNSRLGQQWRPQGSFPEPSAHTHVHIHTHTHTHKQRPCRLWRCSEPDGCFVLIRQLTPRS